MTVDDLAQEIRRVDGDHSLGAGALAEALMLFINGWRPIETAPKRGIFLVWLEKPMLGSRVQPMRARTGVNIIGNLFAFDAPKPTHWMPLPAPPEGE